MLAFKVIAQPARILLFRHGQSAQNVAAAQMPLGAKALWAIHQLFGSTVSKPLLLATDRLSGRSSKSPIEDRHAPLTDLGVEQALLTGRELPALGIQPDVILTSTFFRTMLSGANINRGMVDAGGRAVPTNAFDFLIERQEGRLDGFPRAYLPVLEPEQSRLYFEYSKSGRLHLYRPPGGESMLDTYQRVTDPLLETLAKFPDQTVLIVGHGVTNMCIRSFLLQEDFVAAVNARSYRMPNLALMDFRWQADLGRWVLDPQTAERQVFTGARK